MPGMMETILNLGLNSRSVTGLARTTGNERFAYDAYRRFVQMYSTVVIGLAKDALEAKLRAMKERLKVKDDTKVPAEAWKQLVSEDKQRFRSKTDRECPEDLQEQLWDALAAAFEPR